jgi:HEAT repeat protein
MPENSIKAEVMQLLDYDHFDDALVERLKELGAEAFEVLKAFASGGYEGTHVDHQARAILAVGAWGEEAAVPVLRKALRDVNGDMRIRAMMALGALGTEKAVELLSATAQDDEMPDVELVHCARQISRIDCSSAKAALSDLTSQKRTPHVAEQLQQMIAK